MVYTTTEILCVCVRCAMCATIWKLVTLCYAVEAARCVRLNKAYGLIFFLFVALIYSFVFVLLIHFSHSMHLIDSTHELGLNVIGKRKCECAYGVVQVNIMMDFLYLCCFVSEYSYSIQIGCMHGVRTHTKTRSITIDIMARNVEMVDNKNT